VKYSKTRISTILVIKGISIVPQATKSNDARKDNETKDNYCHPAGGAGCQKRHIGFTLACGTAATTPRAESASPPLAAKPARPRVI